MRIFLLFANNLCLSDTARGAKKPYLYSEFAKHVSIMKRFLFLISMAVCFFTAHAYDYPYLVFTNTEGITTAVNVSNLTLTVNGSEMQLTNDDGTLNFVLTDLASMQFSATETVTALKNVLNADAPVQVFSLTGISLGSYESLVSAARSLGKGIYVFSDGTNSQKIVVK